MIVSLFDNNKEKEGHRKIGLEDSEGVYEKNFVLDNIRKFIIDNYAEHIRNDNIEVVTKKIDEYIYLQYPNTDEESQMSHRQCVLDSMFGYGILQKYIDDDLVSDIRVVRYNQIYIRKKGIWEKSNESFLGDNEFNEYVRYCVLKNNGIINYDTPMVIISDKKFNLRIEAGISPASPLSPSLVIRIHRNKEKITLEKLLIKSHMLDIDSYKILNECIASGKNIVVAGKGGSGKTTLLKALVERIPPNVAITSNEETMELFFDNRNIIQREVIETREEGKKISLEKLSKHSLVMSNDIIVIGELKGKETSIFFDAISTGHMGIATVHSNSAKRTVDRLAMLVKRDVKNQQYKEDFIIRMLSESLDYVIFIKNYKVVEIIKIDYNSRIKEVESQELYSLRGESL